MELKRRLDPRIVFIGLYVLAFLVYIIIGLNTVAAVQYEVSGQLTIPSIDLYSDVTNLEYNGQKLETPDTIVGSYSQAKNKTLLIGHSTTVFSNLNQIELGASIEYNGQAYRVIAIDMMPKDEISMQKLLTGAEHDTIVVMTCAGELFDNGDATHRLIITASNE